MSNLLALGVQMPDINAQFQTGFARGTQNRLGAERERAQNALAKALQEGGIESPGFMNALAQVDPMGAANFGVDQKRYETDLGFRTRAEGRQIEAIEEQRQQAAQRVQMAQASAARAGRTQQFNRERDMNISASQALLNVPEGPEREALASRIFEMMEAQGGGWVGSGITTADLQANLVVLGGNVPQMGGPPSDLTTANLTTEQEIARIMNDQGVDRSTAQALADGLIRVVNDGLGNNYLVNMVTGEQRAATSPPPPGVLEAVPEAMPQAAPSGPVAGAQDIPNMRGGTGAEGVLSNIANTISDTLGGGLVAPENEAAARKLRTLAIRAEMALATDLTGKPSNYVLQRYRELMPTPNSLTEGPDRTMGKSLETAAFLDGQISEMRAVIADPGGNTPKTVAEARRRERNLTSIRDEMLGIAEGMERDRVPAAAPAAPSAGGRTRIRVDADGNVIE